MRASHATDEVPAKAGGAASWLDVAGLWRRWPAWRKLLVLAGIALVAAYLGWRGTVSYVLPDENRPAADRIVLALENYQRANGKAAAKLADLQPKFLPATPKPVPDSNFVYAPSPDGKGFWFGYQTLRDNLAEYDSRAKKWEYVDYEDSFVLRQRNKEFVKP